MQQEPTTYIICHSVEPPHPTDAEVGQLDLRTKKADKRGYFCVAGSGSPPPVVGTPCNKRQPANLACRIRSEPHKKDTVLVTVGESPSQ